MQRDPDEHDYEVGYGKPPRHSRFKPGQSGNPRGRPRGSENIATLINKVLDEKVTVTENGTRKKVSKRLAMFKQIANRAAQGDLKAVHLLIGAVHEPLRRGAAVPGEPVMSEPTTLDEPDRKTLEFLREYRLRGQQEPGVG